MHARTRARHTQRTRRRRGGPVTSLAMAATATIAAEVAAHASADALTRVGKLVDDVVASGQGDLDLLADSPAASALVEAIVAEHGAPLLPLHAVALLIAVTPSDALTAAAERAGTVLRTAPPLNAHVTSRLLDLVASGAKDPARTALLLCLLAPLILGRAALDARDDGGLTAMHGVHLMLASALHASPARRVSNGLAFTQCVQLPIACVRGAVLEPPEALLEAIPIGRRHHESSYSRVGRLGLPLAQALLVVVSAPPEDARGVRALTEAPWDFVDADAVACGDDGEVGDAGALAEASAAAVATPRAPRGRHSGGSPAAGKRSTPGKAALARGERPALRAGDAIIGIDGRLLTPISAKQLLTEARTSGRAAAAAAVAAAAAATGVATGGGSTVRAVAMATVSVLRVVSMESAMRLIERAPPAPGQLGQRSARPGHDASQDYDASPAAKDPSSLIATLSQVPSTVSLRSHAHAPLGGAGDGGCAHAAPPPNTRGHARGRAGGRAGGGDGAGDGAEATTAGGGGGAAVLVGSASRTLTVTSSLESLRGHYLNEARERAAAEGAKLLEAQQRAARLEADAVLEAAETEAEAMRLRKRSQTQVEAEAAMRARLLATHREALQAAEDRHHQEIKAIRRAADAAALQMVVRTLQPRRADLAASVAALCQAVHGAVEGGDSHTEDATVEGGDPPPSHRTVSADTDEAAAITSQYAAQHAAQHAAQPPSQPPSQAALARAGSAGGAEEGAPNTPSAAHNSPRDGEPSALASDVAPPRSQRHRFATDARASLGDEASIAVVESPRCDHSSAHGQSNDLGGGMAVAPQALPDVPDGDAVRLVGASPPAARNAVPRTAEGVDGAPGMGGASATLGHLSSSSSSTSAAAALAQPPIDSQPSGGPLESRRESMLDTMLPAPLPLGGGDAADARAHSTASPNSAASDGVASANARAPALLTLRAGNVTITYQPPTGECAERGHVGDGDDEPRRVRHPSESLRARYCARARPSRRLAPAGAAGAHVPAVTLIAPQSATDAPAASGGAGEDGAAHAQLVQRIELAAQGTHVLSAPGCTMRVYV